MSQPDPFQWDIVYTYTRAQAIADGFLVDVSPTALETGIRFPTAITCAAWQKFIAVPLGYSGQDEPGRLWDVLWMFRVAVRKCQRDRIDFQLYVRNCATDKTELVTLKAICGPGDTAEPVITIMLLDED